MAGLLSQNYGQRPTSILYSNGEIGPVRAMFLDLKILIATLQFTKGIANSGQEAEGIEHDPRSLAAQLQKYWGPKLKEYEEP